MTESAHHTPAGPPMAPREPVTVRHHGQERVDPYAWLRDPDWREAMADPDRLQPAIQSYLRAENAWTEASLADVEPLREQLVAELRGRIKEEDSSVPVPDGPWAYYTRYRAGGQHPLLCRQPREGGDEQILLDGDAEAEGSEYFRLGGAEHSPDHRYLVVAVDRTGAESYVLQVHDLDTGQRLAEEIPQARGDVAWASDGETFLYTVLDEEHRPRWVYRHRLGQPAEADEPVYTETDPGFFLGVERTESGRYLLIDSHDHTTSEVRWLPADRPTAEPRLIAPRQRDVEYSVSDHGDHWLILTNAGGAEDFMIARAPIDSADRHDWTALVEHRPGRLIEGLLVFADWLVRQELEDAESRIVIRHLASGEEHVIDQPDACVDVGLVPGLEYDTRSLRFVMSGFAQPRQVFDYDMESRARQLRKTQVIPSGHDPEAYVSRRFMARAPDGEAVPVSVFHRRDVTPGPQTPLLLYGYGAYGISELPGFSPHRLSLVDRGFVYAIAHVRGGRERGYRWYRQGRQAAKPNTFEDYIACAEALIAEGYTGAGRIAAQGGSAGGMLVGAVLNRRPELFGAAVADVPFVDVLNTMLDPSLPLTPPEWPEWGNPLEDEAAYEVIAGYSPYDNIAPRPYPALLVTAGVSDPRVTYWEPAKWVARLRAEGKPTNLLLLHTNMSAGHGGPGGRFQYLEEVARRMVFLLKALDRLPATT
ncbi:prolyl oligopeptidase family serine peptidase [Spiribacter sp. 2438]|uniref:S9 family peptidase n=1 Tax=Spiribacter sp. 2438 TaxID=2666185 RepID=UPI0012B01804|nr:S9 family peptidase [Spiribacter sp. 2438]QGM21206.1 prolyl oligopeptidase family serine peptidase [Spiribacter sp. 2438]